jgi:hypothetical protein
MEKTKKYRVLVQQVDRYSHEFTILAASEAEAKATVRKLIEDDPLDNRKNTYDGTDVSVEHVPDPIQIHTVEALFDIDKDISDEEVILLDDLSEKQKNFLALVREKRQCNHESARTFFVFSSGGSLKVDIWNGLVIECLTNRSEGNELQRIMRFDLQEYKEHYQVAEIPGDLDILDLGYWNKDGGYEKPVENWRNEMRRVE